MKKRTTLLTILLIAATVLSSCGHKNTFTIEGTIENAAGKTFYLEEITPDGPQFIDSISLDSKGHFKIQHNLPYPTFYNLHCSEVDYVVLLPQAGEKLDISGDATAFSLSYHVEGSPESQLLWQLQDYSNDGLLELQALVEKDHQNREQYGAETADYKRAKEATDSIFRDIFNEQFEYIHKFIEENRGSLSTLIALYKPFNNMSIINPTHNFAEYEAVLEGLKENYPDNPHTLQFQNTVEHLRHARGTQPQDFEIATR